MSGGEKKSRSICFQGSARGVCGWSSPTFYPNPTSQTGFSARSLPAWVRLWVILCTPLELQGELHNSHIGDKFQDKTRFWRGTCIIDLACIGTLVSHTVQPTRQDIPPPLRGQLSHTLGTIFKAKRKVQAVRQRQKQNNFLMLSVSSY